MKLLIYFLVVWLIVTVISCTSINEDKSLFRLQENTNINFSNDVEDTKDFNILTYRNFYNGAGVAIGDINNDGLADVFFTSNMKENKLYLNKGNWKFEDISKKAGLINNAKWATGVVFADVNNDGWLDIYVCYAGYRRGTPPTNELYINNHNLTFTESAKQFGLDDSGYTTHSAFFDYDGDGDLDCYILNNSFIPVNTLNYSNKRDLRAKDWPVADFLKGGGDKLLRNDNGKFVDVSERAGIYGSLIGFGLGVTIGDVNGDHYPDIYISNDFFERDYLYINQRNGTFKEDLENWMQHTSLASMGADIADINNDGYPDIFTTDMLPGDEYRLKTTTSFENIDVFNLKSSQGFYNQFMQNTLQLNNRDGKFMDIAPFAGVSASDWSWGGLMFDADNDGYTDLYICNGINHDVTDQDFIDFFANDVIQKMALTGRREQVQEIIDKMPSHPILNKAFKNSGSLAYQDVGKTWGFTQPSLSNGAAYGDLDNDGDLDLVVNNENQPAFIYRNYTNETTKNNYIGVFLKGKNKNTFAIGSAIKVYCGAEVLSREVVPSRGFQSSVDYKTIIGLGNRKPDSLIVIWPDRTITRIKSPKVNKVDTLNESSTEVSVDSMPELPKKKLLQKTTELFEQNKEDDYIDFYYERNIPELLSQQGPKATVGDVNADGLQDIYITGPAGQAGQLYIQTRNGFIKKEEKVFENFASSEDVATLFFDCDNDGDLDLFIGSGGNNHPAGSSEMQNRLYKNDGKGNFTWDAAALPFSGFNTSVVAANDFNGDGYVDLFVGSRSVPMDYGTTPRSFIYVNDGEGHFKDIAKTKNPDIALLGMVTGAVWADVTGDAKKDLIVIGEWMSPHIFTYKGDHFVELKTNLSSMNGWWQTVRAVDLDGDGKQDLILGNIGDNFYLRPDKHNPVKLYINDLDQNGTLDKLITRRVEGKDVTLFLKKDVTDQITSLRKTNLRYSEFAGKSIQELFPSSILAKSIVKTFNYSSSVIAYNEGNGNFTVKKLPVYVQLSSVNAILGTDVNKDGKPDLLMAGNNFGFQPQFSRLDASYGHVLINKGNRNFEWMFPSLSGLELGGEVRDIVSVNAGNSKSVLFLQNNEKPVLYHINNIPALEEDIKK